jgi:hypothetical protein
MCGVALGVVFALTSGPGASSSAAGGSPKGDGIGTAKFKEQALSGTVSSRAETIPTFTSSFTDPTNGKTYHYTMVGTDPSKGNVTTTIPTVIIPMRFEFDASADPNVSVLDGTDKVAATMSSPVFQSADIGSAANHTASAPPQPPDTPPGVAPDPRIINDRRTPHSSVMRSTVLSGTSPAPATTSSSRRPPSQRHKRSRCRRTRVRSWWAAGRVQTSV